MNVSRIDLSVHTGTHMDAPFHSSSAPKPSTTRRWTAACDWRGSSICAAHPQAPILREHIQMHQETLRHVQAAVFNTGWSKNWGHPRYFEDHPCLSEGAAEFLVDCGVQLAGVDMPSVDRAPYPAHRILLGAGALIVENLTNLDAICLALFQLIVLPLKLVGRDGSPVRAVAVT